MTAPPVDTTVDSDTGAPPSGAPAVDPDPATPATPATPVPPTTREPDKPAAPVEYALTLPENAVLDSAALDRTIAFARESGLSPEVAQKALAFANTEVASAVQASRESFLAAYQPGDPASGKPAGAEWQKMHDGWLASSLADPDLGAGDAAKLDAKVAKAQQAFDAYASPAFKKLLADTGYGSHPEMVRTFAKIGEAMGEQPPVTSGGQAAPDGREALYRLYPTMRPQE